jgi:hypothetical protein
MMTRDDEEEKQWDNRQTMTRNDGEMMGKRRGGMMGNDEGRRLVASEEF